MTPKTPKGKGGRKHAKTIEDLEYNGIVRRVREITAALRELKFLCCHNVIT